jgi:hypothetical protein
MRWLPKPDRPPESIRKFLDEEFDDRSNLIYDSGFNRKAELLQELTEEQGGLCGYTGVAIDSRLASRNPPAKTKPFRGHNEHLKPQSLCKKELEDRGLEPGKVLGEDLDHKNIIAALEVQASRGEIFGASGRPLRALLPVVPIHRDCEIRFRYLANGRIEGLDNDADVTIEHLKLNHPTLVGWRRLAWETYRNLPQEEADLLRSRFPDRQVRPSPEFAFVLENILAQLESSV